MAGSIEKRGKDSYRLVYTNGYDLNGNIIKHTKTIHGTKKDAQIELAPSTYKRYCRMLETRILPYFYISILTK